MGKYLAKRSVAFLIIIFLVSVGSFYVVHLLPGNPVVTILGPSATLAARHTLEARMGLNKPMWEQYFIWIGNVLHGRLGNSDITKVPVSRIISQAFPIDLELIIFSQIISFAIAIPLALQASRKPDRLFDRAATGVTFAGLALPPFIVAPILTLVFAADLHVFPGPDAYVTISQNFWGNIHAMILPSIVLAFGSIVIYYRLLRNDLIATLQEDFILMARSKGQSDWRVLIRHALRPSSVSLLASAGLNIGSLIAGTFIVEYLLGLPGLGDQLIVAIGQVDYVTVQGVVLVVAIGIVTVNFFIDFLYSIVDPRIARG